jgi:Fe-S-cluster containining protein
MIEEIKAAYNEFTKVVGFKCLGCGKCGCKTTGVGKVIFLMKEEVEVLKEKDKLYGVILIDNSELFGGYLNISPVKCAFLTEDDKCEIHDYKPLICLLHPFQVFTVGFAFGGGIIFDTDCSWVKKNRNKLDKPTGKVLDAYYKLLELVMKYKINLGLT